MRECAGAPLRACVAALVVVDSASIELECGEPAWSCQYRWALSEWADRGSKGGKTTGVSLAHNQDVTSGNGDQGLQLWPKVAGGGRRQVTI